MFVVAPRQWHIFVVHARVHSRQPAMANFVQEGGLQLLGTFEPIREIVQEDDAFETLSGSVVEALRFAAPLVADAEDVVLHGHVVDRRAREPRCSHDHREVWIELDLLEGRERRFEERLGDHQGREACKLPVSARDVDETFDDGRGRGRRVLRENGPRGKEHRDEEGWGADSRDHQHIIAISRKNERPHEGPFAVGQEICQIESSMTSPTSLFFPESAVNSNDSPLLLSQEPASLLYVQVQLPFAPVIVSVPEPLL